MGASSTQAGEMLREAQQICDEAERRAEAAEKCATSVWLGLQTAVVLLAVNQQRCPWI